MLQLQIEDSTTTFVIKMDLNSRTTSEHKLYKMKFSIGDGSVESAWVDVIADDGARIYHRSLYATYALLPMLKDDYNLHCDCLKIFNEELHLAEDPDQLELIYMEIEKTDRLLQMTKLLIDNEGLIRVEYHNRL